MHLQLSRYWSINHIAVPPWRLTWLLCSSLSLTLLLLHLSYLAKEWLMSEPAARSWGAALGEQGGADSPQLSAFVSTCFWLLSQDQLANICSLGFVSGKHLAPAHRGCCQQRNHSRVSERGLEVPHAQLGVLNAMSPLGLALPHLPGMVSCISTNKISPVVSALAQLLILLSETHSLKILVLDKYFSGPWLES